MSDLKQLPSIADAQRSPLVERLLAPLEHLLEENRRQAEIIHQMRDQIAVLKGQKAKPKFKPSGMDAETEPDGDADGSRPTAAMGAGCGRESALGRPSAARPTS